MTYIDFMINLIALNNEFILTYLLDISKGLTGIGFVILYFIFMYAMAFWVRPLQRLLKVDAVIETVIWFGILFLYSAYEVFIKQ
jgi:hypothetical protein